MKLFREKTIGNDDMKLSDSPTETINIGPAYNLPFVLSKINCQDCDSAMTDKIQVAYQDFNSLSKENHDSYVNVEPSSGYMINQQKTTSVFVYLDSTLPFPTLDNIGKQMIPFYDVVEKIDMNRNRFNENYGYANSANKSKKSLLITFAVLTGVFFIITVVAIVFCVKRSKTDVVLSVAEATFHQETTEIEDEKKYGKLM
jgi:hypothetical protein